MKKRTFVSGLLAGAILAGATTAFASSDFIQAALYPVKFIINGKEQKLPDEYSILNYNGHAYVPIRFVAEQIGGNVGFIEAQTVEDSKITIDINPGTDMTNPRNNLSVNNEFLSIASQGKLNGIEVPLGTTKQDLLNILGEPDEMGEGNTPYVKYSRTTFYLKDDRVNVIDVGIDISPAKIKELLGKPDSDGMSDAGVTEYVVGYNAGSYFLFFKYSSQNADSGTLRFKNPKG